VSVLFQHWLDPTKKIAKQLKGMSAIFIIFRIVCCILFLRSAIGGLKNLLSLKYVLVARSDVWPLFFPLIRPLELLTFVHVFLCSLLSFADEAPRRPFREKMCIFGEALDSPSRQ